MFCRTSGSSNTSSSVRTSDDSAPAAPSAVPFERDLERQLDDEMAQVFDSLEALDERLDGLDLERMIAAVEVDESRAAERYTERQDSEQM